MHGPPFTSITIIVGCVNPVLRSIGFNRHINTENRQHHYNHNPKPFCKHSNHL